MITCLVLSYEKSGDGFGTISLDDDTHHVIINNTQKQPFFFYYYNKRRVNNKSLFIITLIRDFNFRISRNQYISGK